MMKRAKIFLHFVLALYLPSISAQTDSIYKYTDENGNVIYSQEAPNKATSMQVIPLESPPSNERVEAAKERHLRNEKAAAIFDENRETREKRQAQERKLRQIKQENLQNQTRQNNHNPNDVYPYYPPYPSYRPGQRPGNRPGNKPGNRPGGNFPDRPVHLPAR